jgi:hypothetical protein
VFDGDTAAGPMDGGGTGLYDGDNLMLRSLTTEDTEDIMYDANAEIGPDGLSDSHSVYNNIEDMPWVTLYNDYRDYWLFTNFTSGTIPADSTQTIEVTFDATDMAGGDYSNDIVIASNDPDESEVVVPVSLSVSAYGCTVPESCNYDPDANIDDGSCTYPKFVCEDGSIACS